MCSKFSDAVITINKEDYATMKKMLCSKVYYINGVGVETQKYTNLVIDREEYRKKIGVKENEFMILQVGELSKRKNHQVVIDALSKLENNKYVYVIVGKVMNKSGTYELLKKTAEEKNVNVIFLGFRSDIPELCHCADITVLPSLREGLGLAGIESLASGTPVVGSNIQGIKDYIIDGKTGYLCNPSDSCDVAEKISKIFNENKLKKMKDECIKKSKEFDIEISHSQMKNIYDEIIV